MDINAIKLQHTRAASKTLHDKTGDKLTKQHTTDTSLFSMQRNGTQKARSVTRIVTTIKQKIIIIKKFPSKIKERREKSALIQKKVTFIYRCAERYSTRRKAAHMHILYPLQEKAGYTMVPCQQGISASNVQSHGG